MTKRRRTPQKRQATTALREAAHSHLGLSAHVGRLTFLGEGLSRKTWCALAVAPDGSEHPWVAQVPHPDTPAADLARLGRELDLLGALAQLDLPFRIPHPVARIDVDGLRVHITTACAGLPIDMKGRTPPETAARHIAEVAAAIHAIPTDGLPLPGDAHPTARADALAAIATLRRLNAPFVNDLLAWCTEHLPADDAPARLVHGDLLGQNVLLPFEGPWAVIDWEYTGTGDPAADLAIVTRGKRRVFGVAHGTQLLLDAYNAASSEPISPTALRLRELALVAQHVAAFVEQYPHSASSELARLRNLHERPLHT